MSGFSKKTPPLYEVGSFYWCELYILTHSGVVVNLFLLFFGNFFFVV